MRATTVRPGDQHRTTDGEDIAFTVVSVTTRQRNGAPHVVVARVLYASGTEGDRVWAADTDVPLVRPDTAPRTVSEYRLDLGGTTLPKLRNPQPLTVIARDGYYPTVSVEHGGPGPDGGTAVRLAAVHTGGDVPDDAEAYIGSLLLADGLVLHVYRLTDQP